MSTFWRVVSILELTCQFKVVVTVSYGVSPNQKLYSIQKFMAPLVDDMKKT